MNIISEKDRTRFRNAFTCRAQLALRVREKRNDIDDSDARMLITVLANVLEGHDVITALGAPGDWGYGTPIGNALKEAIIENARMGPTCQAIMPAGAEWGDG